MVACEWWRFVAEIRFERIRVTDSKERESKSLTPSEVRAIIALTVLDWYCVFLCNFGRFRSAAAEEIKFIAGFNSIYWNAIKCVSVFFEIFHKCVQRS